jgi:hypothetical protein
MSKAKSNSIAEQRKHQKSLRNERKQKKQQRRLKKRTYQGWYVGGIILAVVIVIGIFAFIAKQDQPTATTTSNTTITATDLKQVTGLDPTLFSQIGTGKLTDELKAAQGFPSLLTGSNGEPELLYTGAEYCPYCATERWPLVVALSRFGTFQNLGETTSISTDVYPSTATFTFYQSSYSSSYVDFVPVEIADQQGQPLQTLTSEQQNLMNTYDAPPYIDQSNAGSIPFIDIGNRYISLGASYDPGQLRSNPKNSSSTPLSWQEIASQLSTGNALSTQVVGAADYLTAAICSITNNQPSAVCNTSSMQTIEGSLPQAGQANVKIGSSTQTQVDAIKLLPLDARRRQDVL